MTLLELLERLGLDIPEKDKYKVLNLSLVVVTNNHSIGPTSAESVINVFKGFDWDEGRLLLYTRNPLIKV